MDDSGKQGAHGVVRTRFAPSPTGFLHVGGVRTALFAWLLARQAAGQFILRIEDTDRSRHVEDSQSHIEESLKWLGLDWDEGPLRQSERLDLYRTWAKKLLDSGRAYADPYSPEQLEELRQKAHQQKRPFLFREHRPENPPQWREGLPLRFSSDPKAYQWQDEVMGNLSTAPEAIDDFILLKSDGFPTYNFAHIIDDQEMSISHVIRSQEFLSSVPKFLNLYEALGVEAPKLATLPYVLGHDGKKKLSKRDGAKDILDYQKEGYLPEALVSFLATLGWNDGTTQEIYSRQELIKKFSLSRVQKSGAEFDEQRLEWVNGHFIRELSREDLTEAAEPFWPPEAKSANKQYKQRVVGLVQERLKHLSELSELTSFFFEEPDLKKVLTLYKDPVDKQLKNLQQGERHYRQWLQAAIEELAQSDFSEEDIRNRLNNLLERLSTSPGILFSVVRIAATGSQSSPEIFGTLSVLGKEKSLARLQKALDSQA